MADIKRTAIQFGTSVHDCVLRETIGNYKQTRDRVTRFENNKSMSDKEIIEFLAEEIKQYRTRIQELEVQLGIRKEIYTDESIYHCGADGGTGKDFNVTRWYEDGVLIKEEIKPIDE